MTAPYRLHTWPISHWCLAAERMLDLKRIPYVKVHTPYGDHTALLAKSGQDYIPWLEFPDGKGATYDQIPDTLEARHPEPTLFPDGTRARSRLVEDWAHTVVEEAVWKVVCSDAPKVVPEAGGERWVFVEMQERKRGPLDVMAMQKKGFLPEVARLARLAEDLLGEKPYLFGDRVSLGDIALWSSFAPLWVTGNAFPEGVPRLAKWKARIDAIPTTAVAR